MTLLRPSPLRPTDAPVPDAEVLFKEARRRRRHRWLAGACALLVVAVVAALVALWPSSPSGRRPGSAGRVVAAGAADVAAMPRQIVGWTANRQLVVVSTRTGRVERTLDSGVSVFAPGLPSVSVGPNGTVYFESASAQSLESATPPPTKVSSGDQILSVSIEGGPVRDLGSGSDPEVSPDGKFLAYIAPDPAGSAGEAPYLVPPQGIDVAMLSATGAITAVRTLEPGPAQVDQGASDLSWSPDGRLLSFDLYDPTSGSATAWTTPVGPGVASLAGATRIPVQDVGLTWNGFFGTGAHGEPQGIGVLTSPSDGRQTVVTIDPGTGRVIAILFQAPAAVCEAIADNGPNECSSLFSNPIVADSSGSNVLVAGAIPYAFGSLSPTTSGASYLYVWHRGTGRPVRLTGHVDVASWVPAVSG